MRIDIHLTPQEIDDLSIREKTVVVIDVLRASTTIVTALANGAREVIPVESVEAAMKISGALPGGVTLLGGERHGRMVEGFQLGNSPADYTPERIGGKAVIFTSTNGSLAMTRSRYARELLVCGFVNLSAVADHLRSLASDVTIVCAGKAGRFSMEDTVCAGRLIASLMEDAAFDVSLSDGAQAARALFKSFGKNPLKMLRSTEHGRYLQEIGFANDLKLCAAVDAIPVIVRQEGNVLKTKRMLDVDEAVEEAAAHP
jgi:2-phosphosulfolactate phosphatase